MGGQMLQDTKTYINIGLLAHVDAGKTTLAENLLYLTGSIRRLGRVDHKDAFLDTDAMEKARGITIFSKQAVFSLGGCEVTLLDTPGHVDFSAEMERTLQVLDYAVLLIGGADGVQGHVETLWRLLSHYRIPAFVFINKMDQPGTDAAALMEELKGRLDGRCVAFCVPDLKNGGEGKSAGWGEKEVSMRCPADFWEEVAVCDDGLLERYLEGGQISEEEVAGLIAARRLFPCFFGSALKGFGVKELLEGLSRYMRAPSYPKDFGARVFKITRDAQGGRLTHMKITGGSLKVKGTLSNQREGMPQEEIWEEKADQIRQYCAASYQALPEACAGMICAVTGLTKTFAGQGLGIEEESVLPLLEPVLTYRIALTQDDVKQDPYSVFLKLKQLEEEEPELSVFWQEETREIYAQVMGDVQMEILRDLIRERFGVGVMFLEGSIVYKETIASVSEGVGHFEPLRHYAEVHLLLEPGERGSGLQFATSVSEDELDRNWQRLVLTHLEEKKHRGVLVGGEITDMKITLAAGRAHIKHTEGGDFRQATYRALRQGLMKAQNVLLEPVFSFRLEVPAENIGRAMNDIQKRDGSFDGPFQTGDLCVLTGSAPAARMTDYQKEVTAYTHGRGRLSCALKGYEPCHDAQRVVAESGYDPEADTENPASSVFCAHGAGFVVSWDQVEQYMHLESCLSKSEYSAVSTGRTKGSATAAAVSDEELEEIFLRTYKSQGERTGYKKKRLMEPQRHSPKGGSVKEEKERPQEESYLLVDGYNIIFAWEELRALAQTNIEGARNRLMEVLSNYQGFCQDTVILVFDAYRVEGGQGSVNKYHNIYVVFTKEAETADQYIEKTVHRIGRNARITVATSDALEQVIIYGEGARRMPARELLEVVEQTRAQIRELWEKKKSREKNYLLDSLPGDMAEWMEEVRLGKKGFGEE